MERISFRQAQEKDCPDLAILVNSAYRGDSSRQGWTTEADLLGGQRTDAESLQEMLRQPDQVVLLAHQEHVFVGCVFLKKKETSGYLGMLTVRPDLQAAGLGRKLLAKSESWVLENWGLRRMEMNVFPQRTELIQWYQRRGYHVSDRREPFPYENKRMGLPLRPNLEFVVLEKELTFNGLG